MVHRRGRNRSRAVHITNDAQGTPAADLVPRPEPPKPRRGRPPLPVPKITPDLLAEFDAEADRGLLEASPKGTCYDCGKPVPPMRKRCGRCAALHGR